MRKIEVQTGKQHVCFARLSENSCRSGSDPTAVTVESHQ
jgi:hypothetical protein